jgi:putative endonuclease
LQFKPMHYVYILQSELDEEFYIGKTADLKRRYSEHSRGQVESTKHRRPLKLLCYEAYHTK